MALSETKQHSVRGAGGVELFVREGGNPRGPDILFIHGYLFSSDVFVRQFEGPLAETHRLVAMDVRGHGRSGKPDFDAAYTNAQVQADDVAAVVETLNMKRPTMVGWSMGSRVALNYGWFHGYDKIGGLNLVAAVVAGPTRGPDAPLPAHLADLLIEDDQHRLAATKHFVEACAAGGEVPEDLQSSFVQAAMTVPLAARRGSRRWPIHYAESLPELATPLLVTHGAGDPLVPEERSRELADLTRAGKLSVIGGGHLAFLQDSTRFDRELEAFCETTI